MKGFTTRFREGRGGAPKGSRQPAFTELSCPACRATSGKIPIEDRIEQRTFDDVHRRCYINAAPDWRC
jgi:hypothetical protein